MYQALQKEMRIFRFGFTIEEQQKIVGLKEALEDLTPARQRKSTLVVFENEHAVITKHAVVCPWCGKKTPAYHNHQWKAYLPMEVQSAQQTSISEKTPQTLVFNRPIETMDYFICPKCNMESYPSKGFVDVLFTVDKRKIKISRKLELQEWFQIEWGADKICITEFELYETITFNLRNGHTFVSLEDGCGEKLQIRDISNIRPDLYSDDPIFELINLYKPVNRELKNRFVKIFHGPLPFRTKELTVEQFVLMTRFIGYDSGFYNALPYAEKGDLIERRFLKSAKRLHRAVKVPNIFEKTTLPKVKSIRKLLFCNPALFFYTEELEQLWKIIEDVNLFRNFITSQNIFSELAFLHKMPRLINFYAEYKAEIGIGRLYHHFFRATNRYWLYNYSFFAFESVTHFIDRLSIGFNLCKNHFCIHDFRCRFTQRIHLAYPFHRLLGFELFCYTFTLYHLLHQPKKHIFRLFVNVGKITVQFAACKQIRVKHLPVLPDIPQMPLSQYPYGLIFFDR